MLRLTLAQMRRSVGRLTAAAVAIAIGTAFLAATLVAGNVMQRTGYDSVTAQYASADLVVQAATSADVATVRDTAGVTAADLLLVGGAELTHGGRTTYQALLPVPSDERLGSVVVTDGRVPSGSGEIALPQTTVDRLEAELGDELESGFYVDSGDEGFTRQEAPATLVGIVDDPAGAWTMYGGAGLAAPDDLALWTGVADMPDFTSPIVVLTDGTPAVRDALTEALPDADVLTKDEAAKASIEQVTGEGNALLMVVLGFAAIALLVAALVIANTFQVLVAQRARTLALLRCVGAVKGQLRASVLTEAAILGLLSSVVGVLLGLGLSQATLAILARFDTGAPLPATVAVTLPVVLVPLVVGTLVTALAALVPAREATRVSPVAALRPIDAPTVGARAGRVRLVLSLLLVVGGVGGLLAAVAAAVVGGGDPMLLLAAGVAAGAASFVGVLVGAVFWLPRVVSLAGRALAATGSSARLAAANTVRNPRRTAATSTALLIGVTLVALMSTGAASARISLAAELDNHYPVDLTVSTPDGESAVDADSIAQVEAVPGVDLVVAVPSAQASVGDEYTVLRAPDPDDALAVLRDTAPLAELDDSTVVAPAYRDEDLDGRTVTVESEPARGTSAGEPVELTVVHTALAGVDMLVTPQTLARIEPDAVASTLWVALEPGADAATTALAVTDAVSSDGLVVESAAAERQQYERVIDGLLAVVVGLLGVAVVIALVGVANTLSLSVIERRRESATLRAIGLTRRQLRWMLAIEGMLIAGIGALLGVLLGMLYGWAGAAIVLGTTGSVQLAVPWRDLLVVLAVALAAGLLASVLPGRAAARTSPVAALAVD